MDSGMATADATPEFHRAGPWALHEPGVSGTVTLSRPFWKSPATSPFQNS